MRTSIAVLCCLALTPSSVAAQEPRLTTTAIYRPAPEHGPLRKASLRKDARVVAAGTDRQAQPQAKADKPWIERHPVWTGAMIGFGIGVGLTYASSAGDRDEFIHVISPGSAAMFWGGVTAGVGALAGWGIGRNRD
jgi:hypothetical protein